MSVLRRFYAGLQQWWICILLEVHLSLYSTPTVWLYVSSADDEYRHGYARTYKRILVYISVIFRYFPFVPIILWQHGGFAI
jgi:hypothetical protein